MELTITQAAQTLDCSVDTVRRHIRRGKLSARKDEHGRYLIKFDDIPGPKASREGADSLDWLKSTSSEGDWQAGNERTDAVPTNAAASAHDGLADSQFAEPDPLTAPQRRRDDPGLDKRLARLLEERQEMVQELQMWRNEAMAAQVALEELRRLIPRTLEPKRTEGWWRFGR